MFPQPGEEAQQDEIDAKVGEYVAFVLGRTWQLALVVNVEEHGDEREFQLQFMKRSGKGPSFSWTNPLKTDCVDKRNFLLVCEEPETKNGRTFKLNDAVIKEIKDKFNIRKK